MGELGYNEVMSTGRPPGFVSSYRVHELLVSGFAAVLDSVRELFELPFDHDGDVRDDDLLSGLDPFYSGTCPHCGSTLDEYNNNEYNYEYNYDYEYDNGREDRFDNDSFGPRSLP